MKVWNMFRRPLVRGDVGIEVEIEGRNLPRIGEHWNVEHDGSLRGEALEYVFNRPKDLKEAKRALNLLKLALKKNKAEVFDTGRAGVHVHVNCGHLSRLQMYNFFTLYLCFENLLVGWCGEERVGNRFCLRASDAEGLMQVLTEAAQEGGEVRKFRSDDLRYASMNVKALTSYGSLEFRAMRSTDDMDAIYKWAETLVGLRDLACQYEDPTQIVLGASAGGLEAFVRGSLGGMAEELLSTPSWESELYEGIRMAQDLAYCVDWADMVEPPRTVGGIPVPEDFDNDFPPIDF